LRQAAYAVEGNNTNRTIIARLTLIITQQSISNHALQTPISFI